jgi:protoporphyrinogen oxidase
VQLLLDRPPAAAASLVLVPEKTGLGLARIALDAGAAPAGGALLGVSLDEAAALALRDAPDAEVVAYVLRALARTPFSELQVAHAIVRRGAVPRFGPGSLQRLAAFDGRVERSPRLAFAGEWLVGPGLEAAVTSGMRAATEVVRGL